VRRRVKSSHTVIRSHTAESVRRRACAETVEPSHTVTDYHREIVEPCDGLQMPSGEALRPPLGEECAAAAAAAVAAAAAAAGWRPQCRAFSLLVSRRRDSLSLAVQPPPHRCSEKPHALPHARALLNQSTHTHDSFAEQLHAHNRRIEHLRAHNSFAESLRTHDASSFTEHLRTHNSFA
jgi:hypothetical protein